MRGNQTVLFHVSVIVMLNSSWGTAARGAGGGGGGKALPLAGSPTAACRAVHTIGRTTAQSPPRSGSIGLRYWLWWCWWWLHSSLSSSMGPRKP